MKILLAPSETKISGGNEAFNINSLLFSSLTSSRIKLLHTYINILQQGDMQLLSKMFGLKKESEIEKYTKDIIYEPTMKAIQRYSGVAFDYLEYNSLDADAQEYIDSSVILFSNLFGPIRARDAIPEYRLKQGQSVGDIKVEKFYNQLSAELLEEYLESEEILDLRAGFYNKFYKPSRAYTTLKFIKDGKVVSHWAKAYRGIVLRQLALHTIETLDEFIKLPIENLSLYEIIQKKHHQEIIYTIEY